MKNRLKRVLIISMCLLMVSLLAGCGETKKDETSEASKSERTITDLAGKTVTLPAVAEIKNVVIIAPPLLSTYVSNGLSTDNIVGVSAIALTEMNKVLLDYFVPNNKEINTTFVSSAYESNAEELLKLDPDIILVYGDTQKKGLETIQVPVVDFFIKNQVNEDWSVQIDQLMREIFGLEDDNSLQQEWDIANKKVDTILAEVGSVEKQKGMMIMSNTGDKITVRGAGTYGDDWLVKSGLVNAAAELSGENIEVTMEQLLAWNPDIVYVFRGLPAAQYLSGSIAGQDWSQIQAFKDGKIYNTPVGIMNWGTPCADSPLMIQWLVSKNFPEKLSDNEYQTILKEFYERRYEIKLSDEMIQSILIPGSGK